MLRNFQFSEHETSFADIRVCNQTRQQIGTAVAKAHEHAIQVSLDRFTCSRMAMDDDLYDLAWLAIQY
jgi:uncharacterized membrane protein